MGEGGSTSPTISGVPVMGIWIGIFLPVYTIFVSKK
jgi:hypothetical protein